ncbi:MAG: hypothetical protein DMG03_23345 [Acidobacteria bacterium]|nr:MAG: hypothetical protein DMG03_23345 [Acidobacteriota bacterium]
MKPRLLLLATAAALTCLAPAIHTPVRADARRPPSLTALVGRNALTRDTYGDGLPDSVAARVTVPSAPALADIEAATNLAARLGYDTTALSLPIVVRDNEVEQPSAVAAPILVGRENRFIKQLIDTRVIDIAVLKPGQGLIAAVASPLGGGDGLVVVGGDDEGTVNAGVELAARLPRVWGMTGIALPAIEEQAVRYLRSRGINVGDALITSLVVDSDKRGVARVALRIDVPGSPLGSWTFPKDTLYDVNDRSTWPTLYTNNLPTYANIPVKIYGTYLQDDWQAANGLTLNLGIRYDVQVGSFNEDVPGLLAKIQDKLGRDGTFPYDVSVIAQPTAGRGDHNNFGPRVGLAWDPANNGITNVHAAYGLFYDNVRTLTNFNELTWPQAKPITIQNPSYPDPFGGRTREAFLSATPPTITVGSNAQINPYAHQFNVGVNRLLRPDLAVTADFTTVSRYGDRDAPEINIPDRQLLAADGRQLLQGAAAENREADVAPLSGAAVVHAQQGGGRHLDVRPLRPLRLHEGPTPRRGRSPSPSRRQRYRRAPLRHAAVGDRRLPLQSSLRADHVRSRSQQRHAVGNIGVCAGELRPAGRRPAGVRLPRAESGRHQRVPDVA